MEREYKVAAMQVSGLRGLGLKVGAGVLAVTLLVAGSYGHNKRGQMDNQISLSKEVGENLAGEVDLLDHQQWRYMPGVGVTTEGLRINYVGRVIVRQDSSVGEPNSAINLYGPRLAVKGDFEVSAKMQDIKETASLQLYGAPPLVYDEFRYEKGSLRLTVDNDKLYVDLWDGSNQDAIYTNEFSITPQDDMNLTIQRRGGILALIVNNQKVGQIPEHNIFDSGQVWFGADSENPGASWLLKDLHAKSLPLGRLQIVNTSTTPVVTQDPNGFQKLANRKRPGFQIGTAVALGPLVSDKEYANLAASGWYGTWTTENALKTQFVHPQENMYTFGEADAIVELAQKQGIKVHGHALVFGEANPRWLQDVAKHQPDRMERIMIDHIKTVMSHYKNKYPGTIASWDVVNEPLADYDNFNQGSLRQNIWHKTMGESYIDKAFRTAHQIDQSAQLFINDFGLEDPHTPERWNAFLQLIDRLLARDVPISGVGFETHVYEPGDEVDQYILRSRIQQLAQRGLKVRISEMDVYGHNTALQANQFAKALQVCLDEPNCIAFSMWGISERYGSTSSLDNNGALLIGDGLPFGEDQRPLAAVGSMQNVLKHRN